ncbi:DUF3810 domain-containing protein [Clostridium sp. AM58-1XD]|uniref:DUF3810 domain-containing protein n=1 Tax=Clostridium sp. AM58-1XD TaxID=2292307 RepID=UPI000E4CA40E|nr:DUF3810 domain-containing protein [Clostridium sp. AM58-1XD]RGY96301.1 DUF3810 domain-containing protein [Clostridium sp. AM58-1XD]
MTGKESSRNKKYAAAGIVLILSSGALGLAARKIDGFGNLYAETVYPVLVRIIGTAAGVLPFSVSEAGLYILIAACIIYGIMFRKQPARLISRTLCFVGILLFSYMANCGVNYYRLPFSAYAGMERRESSGEELFEFCEYLTAKVNEYGDYAGKMLSTREYGREGVRAMGKLGEEYPVLGGFYPRPKALGISWVLSVQQLSGIYSPFTIEANYNRDMVSYNIPHTLCHELSHLKGFMREDEANFIGYLACIESEKGEFQYSGYMLGWIYATNALAGEDMKRYVELYGELDERIKEDLRENSAFWNRYDGRVAKAADKVNDTYLKMNDQEDGVKSYGRVVDLMLAHYRKMEKKS